MLSLDIIVEIAKRAEEIGLLASDRFTFTMDLSHADDQFNLRLEEFLNADDYNFAHDVIGIQSNMNRTTGKVEGIFIPRYASPN